MTTPNQINGNFSQIAQSDTDGNVTGVVVAAPENIAISDATSTNNDFLQSDGNGALQWAKPIMSYGVIKKMTNSGINGMLTLMEDGRLYLTHAENTTYKNAYETASPVNQMNLNGWFGIEATHEIYNPREETGKIIDAGVYNTSAYALYDTGNLYTWGYNTYGQLGIGSTVNTNRPTLAATNVVQVYTSPTNATRTDDYARLFIKKTDGKIYGCGYNGTGALGIGNLTNQQSFVEITGAGVNPRSVWNLGSFVGCLVVQRADGVVLVAGYNGWGSLGDNTETNINILTAISAWNNGDATLNLELATGGFGYSDTTGYNNATLVMWFKNSTTDLVKTCGSNAWGTIGNGNTTQVKVPYTVTVPGTGRITKIFANGGGPCTVRVLRSTGNLYGWGYNFYGQLATGAYTNNVSSPTLVSSDVAELIDTGESYDYSYRSWTMIKKTDGFYYSCGRNVEGQAGFGGQLDTNQLVRMAYPRGLEVKFFGGYTGQASAQAYFTVDQDGRWWAHGWTNYAAITNQSWGSIDRVSVPFRVTPFNIVLNQFI